MSDNLRDRIAAVLYGNLRRQQGIDRPDRFLDWIDTSELADAVIEALGLEVTVTAKASDGSFRSFAIEGYWEERTPDA